MEKVRKNDCSNQTLRGYINWILDDIQCTHQDIENIDVRITELEIEQGIKKKSSKPQASPQICKCGHTDKYHCIADDKREYCIATDCNCKKFEARSDNNNFKAHKSSPKDCSQKSELLKQEEEMDELYKNPRGVGRERNPS